MGVEEDTINNNNNNGNNFINVYSIDPNNNNNDENVGGNGNFNSYSYVTPGIDYIYNCPSIVTQLEIDSTFQEFDKSDLLPSVFLFLLGFFLCIPWLINVVYLKSRNRAARAIATVSLTLFSILFAFLCLIAVLVLYDNLSRSNNYDY